MRIVIKEFHELTAEELYQILKLRSDIFVVEQVCVYSDCDGRDRNAYHLYLEKTGGYRDICGFWKKDRALIRFQSGDLLCIPITGESELRVI